MLAATLLGEGGEPGPPPMNGVGVAAGAGGTAGVPVCRSMMSARPRRAASQASGFSGQLVALRFQLFPGAASYSQSAFGTTADMMAAAAAGSYLEARTK